MQRYRMKDVPKEQRWSHFWNYYGLTVFVSVVLLALTLYTVYLLFGKPSVDMQIVVLSDQFDLTEEGAIRSELESLPLDVNGDGVTRVVLSYIHFDRAYADLPSDTKQELLTMLSAGDTMVFLANEEGALWLQEWSLLAGGVDFGQEDEIFSLSVSQLPMLADYRSMHSLRLYVSASGKNREEYQARLEVLRSVLTPYIE